MKLLNRFHWQALAQARGPVFAGLAVLAVVALGSSGLLTRAQAAGSRQPPPPPPPPPDEVELLQLLSDFHGALSYPNRNIDTMMSLWADNSSISLNGVTHQGKDDVRTFFTTGGYFTHNWVSLAPEYETQMTIHGNKAVVTTFCIAIDVASSQVASVIHVNATMEKVQGQWLYTSMNNNTTTPAW